MCVLQMVIPIGFFILFLLKYFKTGLVTSILVLIVYIYQWKEKKLRRAEVIEDVPVAEVIEPHPNLLSLQQNNTELAKAHAGLLTTNHALAISIKRLNLHNTRLTQQLDTLFHSFNCITITSGNFLKNLMTTGDNYSRFYYHISQHINQPPVEIMDFLNSDFQKYHG